MSTWNNRSFLEKEAFVHPRVANLQMYKKILGMFRAGRMDGLKNAVEQAKSGTPLPRHGKFVTDPIANGGITPGENARFFDANEIAKHRREVATKEGSGSFLGDAALGLAGLVTPKSWAVKEKGQNAIYAMKQKLEDIDTQAGQALAGNNPRSFRGKVFSVPAGPNGRGIQIGEKTNADGSLSPIFEGAGADRRPSVLAPATNTMRIASPFLAASYLADKMYPQEKKTVPEEKRAYLDTSVALHLEKQASMEKISQLEEELEKSAAIIRSVREENAMLSKTATDERLEKERTLEKLASVRQEMIEKISEADEFRLRTLARERSKSAMAVADSLLANGLIKQAEYDAHIDRLMDCDEESFNLYATMAKKAASSQEGLESLGIIGDYSSNHVESASSRPTKGLSKSGQTIGEAARDLLHK